MNHNDRIDEEPEHWDDDHARMTDEIESYWNALFATESTN